ncbi:MAG: M48 family metalloprotease [Candidatus Omnitrophota bacterium]
MKIRLIVICILVLSLSGCATIYNPATGRQELIFLDTPQEVAIGNKVSRQVEQEYRLSRDPALNERLRVIGENIVAVCERQDVRYHFAVIREKELNAFSLPGGYVYVNTGLMEQTTDDELAGVLAHEIAHVAARHSIKKLQAAMGYNLLMSLALGRGEPVEYERALGIAVNIISLGYEREDEREADKLAVRYTRKAGYDPYAIITMLKKLQKLEAEDPLSMVVFLRSHPRAEERIKLVEAELEGLSIAPQDNSSDALMEQEGSGQKFCPECGTYYSDSTVFCPKDGAKLRYVQ